MTQNTYLDIMESYASNMTELQCSIVHHAKIIERQGKVLHVNAVLLCQLYDAIVIGDDLHMAVALLQDYMEAPPNGGN